VRIGRLVAVSATVAIAGCGGGSSHKASIVLRSPAFAGGGAIPSVYTCDGRGGSPPLQWSGVPGGTRELTLEMRDPDTPGGNFIHWAVAGIAPGTRSIAAGAVPAGAVQGANSAGTTGYTPPCPPAGGKPHHYAITLVALARPSGLGDGFASARLPTAGLATGTLIGTYARR
jgi:Raf kinase inhibitor-like YbhB/YbcL family protein